MVKTSSSWPLTSRPLKSSNLNSRRGDAVAGEYRLHLESCVRLPGLADAHGIVEPFEIQSLTTGRRGEGSLGLSLDAGQFSGNRRHDRPPVWRLALASSN